MKYIIILIQFTILTSAIAQGIEIDSAKGFSEEGIRINFANGHGVQVNSVANDGIHVGQALGDGVNVGLVLGDGIHIDEALSDGVNVVKALSTGVLVSEAGGHGFYVDSAGIDGLFVKNAKFFSMNIQGDKNVGGGGPNAHIAQIYNRNTTSGPDVLALKVGHTSNPGGGINFITFYRGDDMAVGRIEGNGSGGVLYGTSGADFAECLTPISEDQIIEAGDIVGIHAGKISLHTQDAAGVMVITDQPAVLGNQNEDSEEVDEKVSFIGQVLVNVKGEVHAGDWIVASDDDDGTGIAVPSSEITLDHKIVGKAWESNQDPDVKKVNTVVGLDHSEAKDAIIRNMGSKMTDLQSQIDELKNLITKG